MEKYYIVENKYLAEGLAFLGFRYYKFTGKKGFTVYGFIDVEDFRKGMNGLLDLKKEMGNY